MAASRVGGVELGGLRGETLTGFLAALGTLRLLAEAGSDASLSWQDEAPHVAMLHYSLPDDTTLEEGVAAALEKHLSSLDPFPGKSKIKEIQPAEYRHAYALAAEKPDRFAVDLLAAIGNDAAARAVKAEKPSAEGRKPKVGANRKTAGTLDPKDGEAALDVTGEGLIDPLWCVLDGAQQRNLFVIIRRIAEIAKPRVRKVSKSTNSPVLKDRIKSVLFGPWQAEDEKASLYLDPRMREHAYRWANPLSDPAKFDGIANLLALVGLSLLPAVPVDRGGAVILASACCANIGGGRVSVSWPIWHCCLGLNAVRRLLLLPGLTSETPPDDFAARGIGVVFRAEAYPLEKGARNYGYPQPVWHVPGR